jgi:hypothetical protein
MEFRILLEGTSHHVYGPASWPVIHWTVAHFKDILIRFLTPSNCELENPRFFWLRKSNF